MITANEIFLSASLMHTVKEAEVIKAIAKIDKNYKSLCQAFKEILFTDKVFFDKIYCGCYNDKLKIETIAKYLNVTKEQILMSPMTSDIEEFASSYMVYEGLADAYAVLSPAYGLSVNEFLFFWVTIQKKSYLFTCLADLKDKSMFSDSFRETIEKKSKNNFIETLISRSKRSEDFYDEEEDDGGDDSGPDGTMH